MVTRTGEFPVPAQAPNKYIDKKDNKNKVIAGVAAAATALVSGGIWLAASAAEKSHTITGTAVAESSAPVAPGQSGAESLAESEVPTLSANAIDAQKRFDANIAAANASVRHGLDINNLGYGNFFPDDAGLASPNMTPQQILTRNIALTQWIKDNPDLQQSRRDIELLAPINSRVYQKMLDILDSTNPTDHNSTDPIYTLGTPHRFSQGTHDGITATGDTWMIGEADVVNSNKVVAVFEWHKNPATTGGEWQLTATYSQNDMPSFSSTFADILQK